MMTFNTCERCGETSPTRRKFSIGDVVLCRAKKKCDQRHTDNTRDAIDAFKAQRVSRGITELRLKELGWERLSIKGLLA